MAHYVFERNNGFGDYDYIISFDTMEITDYKEFACQVDDSYLGWIDLEFLAKYGFYAVGISKLGLRIEPRLQFVPHVRGFRPVAVPRAPRARGAKHGPRPVGIRPAPHGRWAEPSRPAAVVVPVPAPAPKPVARKAASPKVIVVPKAGVKPGPRPAAPAPKPVPGMVIPSGARPSERAGQPLHKKGGKGGRGF